jgi:hypothetical protein
VHEGAAHDFEFAETVKQIGKSMRAATAVALLLAVAPVQAAPEPAPAPARAGDDTQLLKTLGYSTGQSVFVTHMAVGMVADAVVAKTYTAEQAARFLDTYIAATKGLKEELTKLTTSNPNKTLSENDLEFLRKAISVAELVLKEADDLKTYIATGKQSDADAYDNSRKTALKDIKTLLSIKD